MFAVAPPRRRPVIALLLVWPTLMLTVFFLMPFGIMVAVSFFHRVPGAFFEPAFEFDNYAHLMAPLFLRQLIFSLWIAALAATLSTLLSFPFTWLLVRLGHGAQTVWLVVLLAVLSLSEVIIGFSWSVLLSRTAGLSNILVWLGLLERPEAWTPGFGATLAGYLYLVFPYSVLMLYPAVSRLDPELPEAARMLGAPPLRAFFTVVVPVLRRTIVSAWVLAFVFTLGVYLIPQILGRPQHWTLSVLITDQAVYQSNLPLAAALAAVLLIASLGLIGLALRLGRERGGETG